MSQGLDGVTGFGFVIGLLVSELIELGLHLRGKIFFLLLQAGHSLLVEDLAGDGLLKLLLNALIGDAQMVLVLRRGLLV